MQRFNIYRDQNIALAKSLIFKSDTIAQQMNLAIIESGKSVLDDRSTWRYYQHLAGIRHETDKPLLIRSLDTKQDIELTIANLARHKKTSNLYRSDPDTYIDQLILDNLDYVHYIKGVFWPIPMSVSVPANDCAVLYYDAKLVESQETALIGDLERWLYMTHVRFMADGWKVHNDAFVLGFYLKLFPAIPGQLMFLRQKKVHTVETHSFHVTEFLASHQSLHEFIPYLTQKQKFILYRNIRYWERNSGKQTIFDSMVDAFLTGWSMPAVAYNVSQLIHDPSTGEEADLVPKPTGYAESLNYKERDSGRDLTLVSTADLISKEYGLAYDNDKYESEYQTDLDTRLSLAQYGSQPTKLVEVTSVDPEAIERWEFAHLLFNEWLHYTALGKYNLMHEVLNPTSGDTIKISTKELMALYLYAAFKGYSGTTLDTIPDFNAIGVLIKRWVSVEEMEQYLMPSWNGRYTAMIEYFADTHTEQLTQIENSDEMYDIANTILENKRRRYSYALNRHKLSDNAAGKQLMTYFYRDYKCPLGLAYKNYDAFFKAYAIDYTIISDETWQDIANDAFNTATSYDTKTTVSQAEIQRAMVKLMTTLASYTVHFASKMTGDTYDVTDPITPMMDDSLLSAKGHVDVEADLAGVGEMKIDATMVCNRPLDPLPRLLRTSVPAHMRYRMAIRPGIRVRVVQQVTVNVEHPMVDVVRADVETGDGSMTSRVRNRSLPGFTTDNLE